jgi:mRNA interferase MazF
VTDRPSTVPAVDDEPAAPEVPNRINFAPRLGNVYWCEFPTDARKPEFWKTRPVIVVSYANTLLGPVLVVPLTTKTQPGNKWAYALPKNPVPRENRASWAVCNHLYTVSCSRLSPIHGKVVRLDEAERKPIIDLVRRWVASSETPSASVSLGHKG